VGGLGPAAGGQAAVAGLNARTVPSWSPPRTHVEVMFDADLVPGGVDVAVAPDDTGRLVALPGPALLLPAALLATRRRTRR